MQQRRQAALHAHLVRQRLAAEAAAGQQQLGGVEHGAGDSLQPQHSMRRLHALAAGGSRLLPPHVHVPAGTHLQLEGGHFRHGDSPAAAFHTARSLPAHMYQLHDVRRISQAPCLPGYIVDMASTRQEDQFGFMMNFTT
jgi:hypothetical protein